MVENKQLRAKQALKALGFYENDKKQWIRHLEDGSKIGVSFTEKNPHGFCWGFDNLDEKIDTSEISNTPLVQEFTRLRDSDVEIPSDLLNFEDAGTIGGEQSEDMESAEEIELMNIFRMARKAYIAAILEGNGNLSDVDKDCITRIGISAYIQKNKRY